MAMGRPAKKHRKMSSTGVFVLAFLIFVLVFGLVGYYIVAANPTVGQLLGLSSPSSAENSGPTSLDEPYFTQRDVRSLLVVITGPSGAEHTLVVRTDPQNTKIGVLSLPAETALTVGSEESRLCDLFRSGTKQDIGEVEGALETLLGLSIDNYAVLDYADVENVIDYYDNRLTYTTPEDISYNKNSIYIRLSAGEQILSGRQVSSLLQVPPGALPGGHSEYMALPAQLLCALVNQYLTADSDTAGETVFQDLVNLTSAKDLLISHYYLAREGLEYLAEHNTGAVCSPVTAQGEFVESGGQTYFYLEGKPTF